MSGNVAAVLGDSTKFEFKLTEGEFAEVSGIETLGAIGDSTEGKEKTTISDNRKVYGTGLTDSPDMEIGGIYLSADVSQKAFIDACKAKTEMTIQVTWKNDTVGTFTFQPFGFNIAETSAAEWIKFAITGKQNSDVVWTEATPAP